jgi:hypothetical protein
VSRIFFAGAFPFLELDGVGGFSSIISPSSEEGETWVTFLVELRVDLLGMVGGDHPPAHLTFRPVKYLHTIFD